MLVKLLKILNQSVIDDNKEEPKIPQEKCETEAENTNVSSPLLNCSEYSKSL